MAEAATVTQEVRPLTDDERKSLNELLARDSAFEAPSVRRGEPYVALINLSVPRRGDKERATDLVYAGDTVYLTAEEAAAFNRHGVRDGRQVDVVRKLSGPDGSREPVGLIPPRAVSGRIFRPVPPPPGSDAPRPDPEGSSAIQYVDAPAIPESSQPQPDPSEMADHLRSEPLPDAVDLPPRNAPQRQQPGTRHQGRR
jgi:hypothetical protein